MITRCRPLLGTFVEITVPQSHALAIDAAFAAMAHVHDRMSFHEPGSDLARLRAAPAGAVVAVDRETVAVLRVARTLYEATDGLFDVAIGRELVRDGFLPDDGIGSLERFEGDGADIAILDEMHVRLRRRVLIDLGGIAKGHAVDRAIEALIAADVPMALVNAGGDLRMFGDHDWPVHLRDADDQVRSMLSVRDCAVASSANLRDRRSARGGASAPHRGHARRPVLMDGRVTVVAARCIIADAMTKVAMADAKLADHVLAEHGGFILSQPPMAEAL